MPKEATLIAQIEKREKFFDKIDLTQLSLFIVALVITIILTIISSKIVHKIIVPEEPKIVTEESTSMFNRVALALAPKQETSKNRFIAGIISFFLFIAYAGFFGFKAYKYGYKIHPVYGKVYRHYKIIKLRQKLKQKYFPYIRRGIDWFKEGN